MRANGKHIVSMIAILCLCAILLLNSGTGQAANGLTLSPPLREITLGPGLIETTADVTLQNNTNQPVRAKLTLVDLKSLGEFGGASLGQARLSEKYDLANWMTLPGGDTVAIASGETVKVRVNIQNRADLAPGGHYGAVIISSSANGTVQSEVSIQQQLVSLLFIKKLGGENYGLTLNDLAIGDTKGKLPQMVTLDFGSTGNVHVTPRGYVEITDPKGTVVAKAIINPDSTFILPETSRRLTALFQPITQSNIPGKYKVTAYYRYDGQKDFVTQSIYFEAGISNRILILFGSLAGIVALVLIWITFKARRKSSRGYTK